MQPRKMLLEQLQRFMPSDDHTIPDHVILVNGLDAACASLAAKLVERQQRVICTQGAADVRATMGCLVNKIQKLLVLFILENSSFILNFIIFSKPFVKFIEDFQIQLKCPIFIEISSTLSNFRGHLKKMSNFH